MRDLLITAKSFDGISVSYGPQGRGPHISIGGEPQEPCDWTCHQAVMQMARAKRVFH